MWVSDADFCLLTCTFVIEIEGPLFEQSAILVEYIWMNLAKLLWPGFVPCRLKHVRTSLTLRLKLLQVCLNLFRRSLRFNLTWVIANIFLKVQSKCLLETLLSIFVHKCHISFTWDTEEVKALLFRFRDQLIDGIRGQIGLFGSRGGIQSLSLWHWLGFIRCIQFDELNDGNGIYIYSGFKVHDAVFKALSCLLKVPLFEDVTLSFFES